MIKENVELIDSEHQDQGSRSRIKIRIRIRIRSKGNFLGMAVPEQEQS